MKPLLVSRCMFCGGVGEANKPFTIKHLQWCSHTLHNVTYEGEYIIESVVRGGSLMLKPSLREKNKYGNIE